MESKLLKHIRNSPREIRNCPMGTYPDNCANRLGGYCGQCAWWSRLWELAKKNV